MQLNLNNNKRAYVAELINFYMRRKLVKNTYGIFLKNWLIEKNPNSKIGGYVPAQKLLDAIIIAGVDIKKQLVADDIPETLTINEEN